MKRRNAVIRVLATVCAALSPRVQAQRDDTLATADTFVMSQHQSLSLQLVDEDDKGMYGIDHIAIFYKGRTVTLTAKEIMEALEDGHTK